MWPPSQTDREKQPAEQECNVKVAQPTPTQGGGWGWKARSKADLNCRLGYDPATESTPLGLTITDLRAEAPS